MPTAVITCASCGRVFTGRSDAKTCSSTCRHALWAARQSPQPKGSTMSMADGAFQQPQNFGSDSPPAARAAAALRFNGEPVAAADVAIKHADAAFADHVASTPSDGSLSPTGVKNYIQQFADSPAYKAVGDAVQKVADAADAADANVDSVRAGLSSDGDAATELRNTRFWNRTQRTLDSVSDAARLSTTAQDLVKNATPDQLGVLLDELPSYLLSKGVPSGWLDAATTTVVPELADAKADAALAHKALQVTSYNAKLVQDKVPQTSSAFGYRPSNFVGLSAIR
jgi:hypothetical protein